MARNVTLPLVLYVGAAITFTALAWAVAWRAVDREHEIRLESGTEQAGRLAVFFERHALAALRYGDGYAKMVRREYLASGVDGARRVMLDVPLDRTTVSHVTVIDTHGTPVFNSGFPIRAGTSAADRDYFVRMRDGGEDTLLISSPNRGRNSGRLIVRLVRRVTRGDGTFGGVVFAALDAESIVAFFSAVSPGPQSSATLVGADRRIRARSSYGRLGPGQDISGSRLWRELEERPVGGYFQTSVVDGVTRFYAYRRLDEYPLVVAIGVARGDISSATGAYGRVAYLIAALATVVIVMATVLLVREGSLARRLGELRDALERRFIERTAELEAVQEELLASERMAALGQLTGTVAHELRNPLSTIDTSTAIIERRITETGVDVGASPHRIRRSVERCDAIVTELLDFARARGPEPRPTEVDAWLAEVLAELDMPDGVTLESVFGVPGKVIALDPERVRRAIVNLVENARDAVAGAGGRILVSTRPDGAGVTIEVRDDGEGIPAEVLARIREPLFSTKPFGFGLGVPIVERIAREHGGTFEIISEPGEGTRVVLGLPAVPPDTREDAPCAPGTS